MKQTMLGVIEASTHFESLKALTKHTSTSALPFAGRYRLIDFMLSQYGEFWNYKCCNFS